MKYQRKKPTTFVGLKPMTKYFTASEITKKKAYEILKRANGISKGKAYKQSGFYGIQIHDLYNKNIFQLMKYQKRA